jgi:hypothetical protein
MLGEKLIHHKRKLDVHGSIHVEEQNCSGFNLDELLWDL